MQAAKAVPREDKAALLLVLVALIAGAALRLLDLAARPMHADEAVLADKTGTLLESGEFRYDPRGYHGPLLHDLAAPLAAARGQRTYASLDETTLRLVPALAGLLLILSPLLFWGAIDPIPIGAAALLLAVSPAMVYYSRYYIPETLLALMLFAMAGFAWRALETGRLRWALLAGLAAGLAFAAKETAVLGFAALAVALFPRWRRIRATDVLFGALTALAVSAALLTAFGSNPSALRAATLTYFPAAFKQAGHAHPWYFYARLLLEAEAPLVLLAAFGAFRSLRPLPWYAAVLAILYSLLSYKTPWCLLSFWSVFLIPAGAGLAHLFRRGAVWIAAGIVLVAALAGQAWLLSVRIPADPGNPFAYSATSPEVLTIPRAIEALSPEGRHLPVQVFSRQNVWPLPWYLRTFPNVRYARTAPADLAIAPVILCTPEMEAELARRLYEVPPPGERDLYLELLRSTLRPGLELRGYYAARPRRD